jgi:MerR-like DNA binding protein
MSDRLLTIGELARRAGVATSALRYYEELGLLPTAARISGQRRYPESAVGLVGIILLLRPCRNACTCVSGSPSAPRLLTMRNLLTIVASPGTLTAAGDGWHGLMRHETERPVHQQQAAVAALVAAELVAPAVGVR